MLMICLHQGLESLKMSIWFGSITLDERSHLQGLQLIDRSAIWQSDILRGSTLGFRSFVKPGLIPYYARVGPILELHTNDAETSQWLENKLTANIWLENEDLDCFDTIQCPVGLLVSLDGATRLRASGPTASDLLVYGILSATTSYERPPTPRVSSSPDTEKPTASTISHELKIFAAPISRARITRAQALLNRQDLKTTDDHGQFAQFLPGLHSPSPKRKRVATLFESVAQHHKRVRHKGGEGVSLLMAQSLSQSSQQSQNYKVKRDFEEPSLPLLGKISTHRSRSLSISSNLNPNKVLDARVEHSRPRSSRGHSRQLSSRKGTPALGPSEAPVRRERVLSPAFLSSEGKEPHLTPKAPDAIISENKNTITRTILTCMRLYGFNRVTRPVSSGKGPSHNDSVPPHNEETDSQLPGDSIAVAATNACGDEDEFKSMYHATYRASTFALRKYLKEPIVADAGSTYMPPVLEKGKAMTYIDGFLKLFCEEEH
ncbi:hypothetical protein BJX70DRAFT_377167 [Aspergillus crustosus]